MVKDSIKERKKTLWRGFFYPFLMFGTLHKKGTFSWDQFYLIILGVLWPSLFYFILVVNPEKKNFTHSKYIVPFFFSGVLSL